MEEIRGTTISTATNSHNHFLPQPLTLTVESEVPLLVLLQIPTTTSSPNS